MALVPWEVGVALGRRRSRYRADARYRTGYGALPRTLPQLRLGHPQGMSTSRSSDRLIAQQTLWLGATSAVQVAGGVAYIVVATRILGAGGFGALAVVMATCGLVHSIIAIPGGDTVTTFASRSLVEGKPAEAAALVRSTMAVSAALSLIALGCIGLIAMLAGDVVLIGEMPVSILMLYATVGVFLATNSTALAVLRLADQLRASFLVCCADNLVRVVILASALAFGGGLDAVVSASVAGAAVNGSGLLIASALFARRAGITGLFDSAAIRIPRDVTRFHFTMFGRTAAGTIAHNVDSILLAQFISAADVGFYRGARHLVDLGRQPLMLISLAVQPVLSRLWFDGQGKRFRETVGRFTALSVTLALLGFGVLAWLSEEIAMVVLAEDFAPVAPLILLLLPGALVSGLAVPETLPIVVGRTFPALAAAVSGLVALLVAVWLLVPSHGVAGGAMARTAVMVFSFAALVPAIFATLREAKHI